MEKILEFLSDNWLWILPIIYEIIARLKPTDKNWSLVDLVVKVVDYIITNRKKSKKLMVLLPLFFALSFNSYAQPTQVGRAFWMYQTGDSTAFGSPIPDGVLWQNSSTGKLRGKENGTVYDLISSGGTTLDSTNFWRTKSDFSIDDFLLITHTSFGGESFFSAPINYEWLRMGRVGGTTGRTTLKGGSTTNQGSIDLVGNGDIQISNTGSGVTKFINSSLHPLTYSGDYTANMTDPRDIIDLGFADSNYWLRNGNFSITYLIFHLVQST